MNWFITFGLLLVVGLANPLEFEIDNHKEINISTNIFYICKKWMFSPRAGNGISCFVNGTWNTCDRWYLQSNNSINCFINNKIYAINLPHGHNIDFNSTNLYGDQLLHNYKFDHNYYLRFIYVFTYFIIFMIMWIKLGGDILEMIIFDPIIIGI